MLKHLNKFYIGLFFISFIFSDPTEFDADGDGQYDGLSDYEFTGSVSAVVEDGTVGSSGDDYLVAYSEDEIRGVGLATTITFGDYEGSTYFPTTIGANGGGETITFAFYNTAADSYTPINESVQFEINMVLGNVVAPELFTLGSGIPVCEDDDSLVAPFD